MRSCCSRGSRYLHPSSDPPLLTATPDLQFPIWPSRCVCGRVCLRRSLPSWRDEKSSYNELWGRERGGHRHMSAPVWRLKRHGLSFIYLINLLNCLNCLFVEYLLGCISTEDERGDEKSVHVWGHQKSRSCKLLLDIIRVLFYILGPFSLKICFGFSLLLFLVITLCSG